MAVDLIFYAVLHFARSMGIYSSEVIIYLCTFIYSQSELDIISIINVCDLVDNHLITTLKLSLSVKNNNWKQWKVLWSFQYWMLLFWNVKSFIFSRFLSANLLNNIIHFSYCNYVILIFYCYGEKQLYIIKDS